MPSSKIAWARIVLGLILATVGILTQFNITINKSTTIAPAQANPASFPAVKRTHITEAACRGIKRGDKVEDLNDRFKSDSDHMIAWRFPLAEDHNRDCVIFDDGDENVDAVSLDLVGF